jgi:hypothetical protein
VNLSPISPVAPPFLSASTIAESGAGSVISDSPRISGVLQTSSVESTKSSWLIATSLVASNANLPTEMFDAGSSAIAPAHGQIGNADLATVHAHGRRALAREGSTWTLAPRGVRS